MQIPSRKSCRPICAAHPPPNTFNYDIHFPSNGNTSQPSPPETQEVGSTRAYNRYIINKRNHMRRTAPKLDTKATRRLMERVLEIHEKSKLLELQEAVERHYKQQEQQEQQQNNVCRLQTEKGMAAAMLCCSPSNPRPLPMPVRATIEMTRGQRKYQYALRLTQCSPTEDNNSTPDDQQTNNDNDGANTNYVADAVAETMRGMFAARSALVKMVRAGTPETDDTDMPKTPDTPAGPGPDSEA